MGYNILKSDGTLFFTLEDGQINDLNTSLTFIGKNFINYGKIQNENFLHLLENFSSTSAPVQPVTGQLWFDKSTNSVRLRVYNGTSWHLVPNIIIGSSASGQQIGDFWFDTNSNRLKIKTSSDYIAVGDGGAAATAGSLAESVTINGVAFDGSQNITVTSTLTNRLIRGSYLTGSSFNGSTSTTWAVDVGTVTSPTGGKVVARDENGDIYARNANLTGELTAMGNVTAFGADLAEKYIADTLYEVGTVVTVGGIAEITACNTGDFAIGVISDAPAYTMNVGLTGGTLVALKGRVPVNVTGSVKKGQQLIAGPNGTAIVTDGIMRTFAVSLTDDLNGVVEAIIL